jgi:hypothetical protein
MSGGLSFALGLLAFFAIGCFDSTRPIPVTHPLAEAFLNSDGTEVVTRLAKGVKTGDVLDLAIFGKFRAGMTPTEARNAFGPPTRVTRDESGTSYIYERDSRTIKIVQFEELSSDDDSTIVHYSLEAVVSDPPFASLLPESLRRLLTVDDRLRTVAIGSLEPLQPSFALHVVRGRVQSVGLGPSAPDNNKMQLTSGGLLARFARLH